MNTSPQFANSVLANLNYWDKRLQSITTEALTSLEADWQNLVQALRFGFALENATPLAIALAARAFDFAERRGYWQEWLPMLERAVRLCGPGALALRCQLLDQIGSLRRIVGQVEAAQQAFQEAATIAQELADQRQLGRIQYHLAIVHQVQRNWPEAEQCLLQAQALFREHGTPAQRAAVENVLGMLAQDKRDFATAEACYTRSLNLWRTTARPNELARLYLRLGQVAHQNANPAAALAWGEQAQTLYAALNDNPTETIELAVGLGSLYFDLQAWDKAEEVLRQADAPALRRAVPVWYRASLANNLGNVLLEQSKWAEAKEYLQTALDLYRQRPDDVYLGNVLCTLGVVSTALEQYAEARTAYDEALVLLARHPQNAFAQQLWVKYKRKRDDLDTTQRADD